MNASAEPDLVARRGRRSPLKPSPRQRQLPRLCVADDGSRASAGIATRFVTGYLYDAALDGAPPRRAPDADEAAEPEYAARRLHARWLRLPARCGWVAFGPTNSLMGGSQLIRRRGARPAQATPISAAGSAGPSLRRLTATVQVRRVGHGPPCSPRAGARLTERALRLNTEQMVQLTDPDLDRSSALADRTRRDVLVALGQRIWHLQAQPGMSLTGL